MSTSKDQQPPETDEPSETEGQVSEVAGLAGDPPGGADATDKSTGTAPSRADEPEAD